MKFSKDEARLSAIIMLALLLAVTFTFSVIIFGYARSIAWKLKDEGSVVRVIRTDKGFVIDDNTSQIKETLINDDFILQDMNEIDVYYFSMIPEEYKSYVAEAYNLYQIPVYITYKQIDKESRWGLLLGEDGHGKTNGNGSYDIGLAQLNNRYIAEFSQKYWDLNEEFNPYDERHSIIMGASILRHLITYFDEDLQKGLSAYNCGATAVRENKIPVSTKEYVRHIIF